MSRVLGVLMSVVGFVVGAHAADLSSQAVANVGMVLQRNSTTAILLLAAAVVVVLYAMRRRKRLRNERS